MRDQGLLRIGILGTMIAVLCCFTPVLVVLLGAVGCLRRSAGSTTC
jgi:mercuric ion transport protein